MKHLFSTRVKVLLIAAVLVSAGLAILSGATNRSIPSIIVQGILTPFRAGANALTKQSEQIYGYIFRYESLVAENDALKKQISRMEDDARQADSYYRENQRLRDALALTQTREDFVLVDAYIIAWGTTDWNSTVTVSKGSNAGIETGMCAITANGEVVGLVTEVGINYAVIKTVLDSTLEISATISSSGHNGMVKGGYTDGRKDLLWMNYLPSAAVIRNNDQVVTSGSTVYPRNLILGHIVDAGYDETGVAKYAVLNPAVDIGSLEQVFILTEYTTITTSAPSSEPAATEATQGVG